VAMVEEDLGEAEEDIKDFGHNHTGYRKAFSSACGVGCQWRNICSR
jgi:hypothetical protein